MSYKSNDLCRSTSFKVWSLGDFIVSFPPLLVDPDTCLDSHNNTYLEGDRFYTVISNVSGSAVSAAADIIFVVDESGSMFQAQQWIRTIAPLLETALQDNGVGVGNVRNQFALVGFGQGDSETISGTVISQLTSVDGFVATTHKLHANGTVEDGYSAIQTAVNEIDLRSGPNMVHIMILVTNEDRIVIKNLAKDGIEEQLRGAGFVLNVVVSQRFEYGDGDEEFPQLAFGMDSNGTCYSYDSSYNVIHPSCKAVNLFVAKNTYEDYIQLAYNLQGSAWDIRPISDSNSAILEKILQLFVDIMVEEVMGFLQYCVACTCHKDLLNCKPVNTIALENCEGHASPEGKVEYLVLFITSFMHVCVQMHYLVA